jgi:hypothetical protein
MYPKSDPQGHGAVAAPPNPLMDLLLFFVLALEGRLICLLVFLAFSGGNISEDFVGMHGVVRMNDWVAIRRVDSNTMQFKRYAIILCRGIGCGC